eukprot:TRINITY_DN10882_c0_g3_i1.p1 TRINITY_DN10882_c0_g3~~TRINITY_DN10882_c0_g3_i1.p1  ORF type:complete len:727 (+),score=196.19 TRINITY_DN10882_c0_g3_i1:99-2279(+)
MLRKDSQTGSFVLPTASTYHAPNLRLSHRMLQAIGLPTSSVEEMADRSRCEIESRRNYLHAMSAIAGGPLVLATVSQPAMMTAASENNEKKRPVSRRTFVDEKLVQEEKVKAYEKSNVRQGVIESTGSDARRIRVYEVLESLMCQVFMAAITTLSVALIVIETDMRALGKDLSGTWMDTGGKVFLGIFMLDVVGRLYVFRQFYFNSLANVLDISIVIMDLVLETTDLPSIVATLKVFRFIRLARVLRCVTEFRELYLIMMGIVHSVRALAFGSCLVFIVLTLFSILSVTFLREFTQELFEEGVFGDCQLCDGAFNTVMDSNLIFMQTIIASDSWGTLAIPLIRRSTPAALIMIGAFIVVNLGLLNTIAWTVIVDRQQAQERQNDIEYMHMLQSEELLQSYAFLQVLFEKLDTDNNGTTDLNEMMEHYDSSPEFRTILNRMDIHKADLPIVFDILDSDRSGDLEFAEFVSGLHALRHENQHTLAIFTRYYCERLYDNLNDFFEMRECLSQTHNKMEHLIGVLEEKGAINMDTFQVAFGKVNAFRGPSTLEGGGDGDGSRSRSSYGGGDDVFRSESSDQSSTLQRARGKARQQSQEELRACSKHSLLEPTLEAPEVGSETESDHFTLQGVSHNAASQGELLAEQENELLALHSELIEHVRDSVDKSLLQLPPVLEASEMEKLAAAAAPKQSQRQRRQSSSSREEEETAGQPAAARAAAAEKPCCMIPS